MKKNISIEEAIKFAVEKHRQGKLSEAEVIYKLLLSKQPNNPNILHLYGLILHQLGKSEIAEEKIKEAIKFKSDEAIFYSNLGLVNDALGKEEEAEKNYLKAFTLESDFENAYIAHFNLGVYYKNKGEFSKALHHYKKSIGLNESFAESHWNNSLLLLLLGNFNEGWKEYEYRFTKQNPVDKRVFNKPRWDGSNISGKKLLIVYEQGFGDAIQFIRYIPLIKDKGIDIFLECKREMIELFKRIPEVDEIIEKKENEVPEIDFDYYIHIMSLPMLFNTDLTTIPCKIPYLKTDENKDCYFKNKLGDKGFKIGICWSGNSKNPNDSERSINFESFKFLTNFFEVKLVSLQKGKASKELNDERVIDFTNELNNFSDTASLIKNLDLIISVDTAVAHLAGALGKPTWLLLPIIPDWRWLLGRKDTPWYPTIRLFRQQNKGEWEDVFNRVKKELKTVSKNLKTHYI